MQPQYARQILDSASFALSLAFIFVTRLFFSLLLLLTTSLTAFSLLRLKDCVTCIILSASGLKIPISPLLSSLGTRLFVQSFDVTISSTEAGDVQVQYAYNKMKTFLQKVHT
jgi:hypothetical protein